MSRTFCIALTALFVCSLFVGAAPDAYAKKKGEKLPPMASDEEAEAALDTFKSEFKAKGLKGDDKLSQRDWAMSRLAKVQHRSVVDALAKVTKSSDETLRMLGVIYLGEMRAMPAYAGEKVLAAMNKNKKDEVFVISALQSLGSLKYLGGGKELSKFLKHRSFIIKKSAIIAVGETGDIRLLEDLLKIIGMETKNDLKGEKKDGGTSADGQQSGGGEEVVEEGYSWEGVDVTYDTGTAGDHDQRMAEAIGEAQLAANRAAAEAGANRSGGGATGGGGPSVAGGPSGGRGGSSRSTEELIPVVARALKKMTGEEFDGPGTIRKWIRANRKAILNNQQVMDKREKEQREAAKKK